VKLICALPQCVHIGRYEQYRFRSDHRQSPH
jgi:hypothetical protein